MADPPRTPPPRPARYLFIGGLHRSGTSLVARLASHLPGASGIMNSDAPENEGAYLQGAIPHTAQHGRPMFFATNPEEHLTEHHALNSLETKQRLEHDWAPYFPADLKWRVEKSPVNLTRMRLLQQLFPMAQFVVVLRHPEAVAASVKHWVKLTPEEMYGHWLAAHHQLLKDAAYLHALLVLRYEDVVASPSRALAQLAAYLDLAQCPPNEAITDGNAQYANAPQIGSMHKRAISRWGYEAGLTVRDFMPLIQHPLRDRREAVVRALQD